MLGNSNTACVTAFLATSQVQSSKAVSTVIEAVRPNANSNIFTAICTMSARYCVAALLFFQL